MGQSHQLPPVPSHSLVRALQCPQICWKFVHFGGAGCSVDPSGTCPPTSQSQHPWPGQVLSPPKGWLCPFQPPCSYLPSHSPQSSQRSFTPLLTVPRFLPIALRTKSNSLRWLQNFSCNVLFATHPRPPAPRDLPTTMLCLWALRELVPGLVYRPAPSEASTLSSEVASSGSLN